MANRTARGTFSEKTSDTTGQIANVVVPIGHSLTVAAANDDAGGVPTSVVWGARGLGLRASATSATVNKDVSVWHFPARVGGSSSRNVDITYGTACTAKAAVALTLDSRYRLDDSSTRLETSTTTTPATGVTGALVSAGSFTVGVKYEIATVGSTDFTAIGASANTVGIVFTATGVGSGTGDAREALDRSDGFAIAFFAAAGPSSDVASAPQIRDNGTLATATIGQQAGTSGGAPNSNVYLTEVYYSLTSDHFSRGLIAYDTARRFANAIVVFQPSQAARRASMGVFELSDIIKIFEDKGTPIPDENMSITVNQQKDRWEVYDRGADIVATDTLVAYYEVDGAGIVEV